MLNPIQRTAGSLRRCSFPNYLSVVFALGMLSCAAQQAPDIITIRVQPDYHGKIHVQTCSVDASSGLADSHGNVSVKDCPTERNLIELTIERGNTVQTLTGDDELSVTRTGDSIVVSIDGQIP
jgi:hypothetical protein